METVTVELSPSAMLAGSTDRPNSEVSLSATVTVAEDAPTTN